MNPNRQSAPWPVATFVLVFVVVLMGVVMTSTMITFILPEAFTSAARINLEFGPTGASASPQPQVASAPSSGLDKVQGACEIMQSQVVLEKVVQSQDLNVQWGNKYNNGLNLKTLESLGILRARLEVHQVRNTSLIEIRAWSDKPTEAANIANAVAEAYRNYAAGSSPAIKVEFVDRALPNSKAARPNKPLNIASGVGIGIVLGAVCGWVTALLVRRFQSKKRGATPPPVPCS